MASISEYIVSIKTTCHACFLLSVYSRQSLVAEHKLLITIYGLPMPKILIISNTSWNLYNFRLPLMSRLRKEGYEVVAVAPHDEYSDLLVEAGFHYIDLSMNNKGTNPVEDIALSYRFFKLFITEQPDIVLTYTPKPNIYASIAGGFSNTAVIPNVSGLRATLIRQNLITGMIKFLYR